MLSALRKSELCRFRVKQQGNKLEQLMLQYEKKINKIAGHRAFFMADANQYVAASVIFSAFNFLSFISPIFLSISS